MSNEEAGRNFFIFVISPFGKKFNKIFEEGIMNVKDLALSYNLDIKRADMNLQGLRLAESVHQNIHKCNFCIADITDCNANVLYEIGFAQALMKEVIIIKNKKSPDIPVDISDRLIHDYEDDNLKNLTHYLFTAIRYTSDRLQSIKREETIRDYIKDEYQVTCYKNRATAKISDVLKNAHSTIDVLETNLATIVKLAGDIEFAMKNNENLKIRILTLDPESFFVAKRAEQLGVPTAYYRQELHQSIVEILKKFSKYGDRSILKTYDNFPTQITFIVDDNVYLCSMAMTYRSRELCTIKINRYALGAEASFVFHFESLWKTSNQYESLHFIPNRPHLFSQNLTVKTEGKISKKIRNKKS